MASRKIAERLKNKDIRIIYTSDLKRAKETAEIIAKHHNLQIKIDKRLRDRDTGDCAGTKIRLSDHFKQLRKKAKRQNVDVNSLKFPGGESTNDHIIRTKEFLKEINNCKENILIVAHGGTNKVIMAVTKKEKDRESIWKSKQKNTCVNILKKERGIYKIILTNCTKHLES
ncbi:histidine phosphatase family protein [Candidatus Pacearchaeota archaeon]|nr:histidine phosphatase family protein [Candidatus Pacearchaeota archaeon]